MTKCKVIAIANQKGGTAKTTTTLNLGIGLAENGKRVLLVDAIGSFSFHEGSIIVAFIFFNLGQGSLNWDFPEVYPHFLSLLFYPSIS